MPQEERGRTGERCSVHGSSPSVATCDGCGRALCLACAVPVRGRTLGAECLASAIGADAPVPDLVAREPGSAARMMGRAAFVVAALATVLPWSRFGPGSQAFGAWSTSFRWSLVPAVAALVGIGVSVLRRVDLRPGRSWDAAAGVAGIAVVLGSILAVARPPAFTAPWLGPWVGLAGGVVASASALGALRRTREREPANV